MPKMHLRIPRGFAKPVLTPSNLWFLPARDQWTSGSLQSSCALEFPSPQWSTDHFRSKKRTQPMAMQSACHSHCLWSMLPGASLSRHSWESLLIIDHEPSFSVFSGGPNGTDSNTVVTCNASNPAFDPDMQWVEKKPPHMKGGKHPIVRRVSTIHSTMTQVANRPNWAWWHVTSTAWKNVVAHVASYTLFYFYGSYITILIGGNEWLLAPAIGNSRKMICRWLRPIVVDHLLRPMGLAGGCDPIWAIPYHPQQIRHDPGSPLTPPVHHGNQKGGCIFLGPTAPRMIVRGLQKPSFHNLMRLVLGAPNHLRTCLGKGPQTMDTNGAPTYKFGFINSTNCKLHLP